MATNNLNSISFPSSLEEVIIRLLNLKPNKLRYYI